MGWETGCRVCLLHYLLISIVIIITEVKISLNTLYYHTGDDRPDMRDLYSNIVRQYAVQWERLGLELGLQEYDIANISENNSSRKQRQVEVCCSQMLQKWLEIDPSATWGKLDDAVKNIKLSSTISPVSTGGNHCIISVH